MSLYLTRVIFRLHLPLFLPCIIQDNLLWFPWNWPNSRTSAEKLWRVQTIGMLLCLAYPSYFERPRVFDFGSLDHAGGRTLRLDFSASSSFSSSSRITLMNASLFSPMQFCKAMKGSTQSDPCRARTSKLFLSRRNLAEMNSYNEVDSHPQFGYESKPSNKIMQVLKMMEVKIQQASLFQES